VKRHTLPSMTDKEVIKGSLLTLLLVPLTIFCSGMICGMLTYFIFGAKVYHGHQDPGSEVSLVSMTTSMIASVGFTLAIIPLVFIPANVVTRWVAVVFGIMIPGIIFYGNRMYHVPGHSVNSLILMILVIPTPSCWAAGFVFRIARARPPAGERLVRPLLWAFGTILLATVLTTFETIYLGGLPLSQMPTP
jgi:hypothetical protein